MKVMARKIVITFFVLIIFIFFNFFIKKVFAVVDCSVSATIVTQADKDFCQTELDALMKEQADLEATLKVQQQQTGTLKGDVLALTTQINALKTKVKARGVVIAQLKNSIQEKVSTIESLSQKIEREHESLAQLLRNTNEFDNQNLVNLILSNNSISNFYSDLESYNSIKQAIKNSVDIINGVKTQTEVVKSDLEKKKNAETDAKAELESTQKKVTQSEADKKALLAISKDKEAAYQKLAAQKKAQADKIRSALFSLAGISQKIEFGTALAYANETKNKFGIDPAFLLAIFTQESTLGSNVGQCNVPNTPSWDKIMPGPAEYQIYLSRGRTCKNSKLPCSSRDDQTPFQDIVNSLGINPYSIALSCPIVSAGPWGGAMGPAQFIPSTWAGYISRLKDTLGHNPNPWDPRDAFFASAMHLADLGAVGTSASAQSKAACKYYGDSAGCSYGRSVMNLKSGIQAKIDCLNSNTYCNL